MKREDIRTYGFMGAIRKHFEDRAEARKPPPTEHERIRKAIEDIYSFLRGELQPPYCAGRYTVEQRHYHCDGESGTDYVVYFNGTMIWRGTYYGYHTPFFGNWTLTGPWEDHMLVALEFEVAQLCAKVEKETIAKLRREQEELEAEERAAEERHQNLIRQFHEENRA